MSKNPRFVERRDDGKYMVKKTNAGRASGIFDTQKEAIEGAREMTDGPVHVERVRYTEGGSLDKWRKA
jgi:hypothetical protein